MTPNAHSVRDVRARRAALRGGSAARTGSDWFPADDARGDSFGFDRVPEAEQFFKPFVFAGNFPEYFDFRFKFGDFFFKRGPAVESLPKTHRRKLRFGDAAFDAVGGKQEGF